MSEQSLDNIHTAILNFAAEFKEQCRGIGQDLVITEDNLVTVARDVGSLRSRVNTLERQVDSLNSLLTSHAGILRLEGRVPSPLDPRQGEHLPTPENSQTNDIGDGNDSDILSPQSPEAAVSEVAPAPPALAPTSTPPLLTQDPASSTPLPSSAPITSVGTSVPALSSSTDVLLTHGSLAQPRPTMGRPLERSYAFYGEDHLRIVERKRNNLYGRINPDTGRGSATAGSSSVVQQPSSGTSSTVAPTASVSAVTPATGRSTGGSSVASGSATAAGPADQPSSGSSSSIATIAPVLAVTPASGPSTGGYSVASGSATVRVAGPADQPSPASSSQSASRSPKRARENEEDDLDSVSESSPGRPVQTSSSSPKKKRKQT